MSERVCFYVVTVDGHWAVRFDHRIGADKFVTLVNAIEAARSLAVARWERQGLPSGVQIETPDGRVLEDLRVG